MKTFFNLTAIVLTLFLTGCGMSTSMVGNVSNTVTTVELSKKNFKVLEKVTGTSTNTYIFGIGGLSNRSLVEKAKNQMMGNADLTNGSKTVINITYDTHMSLVYPIFFRKEVTASGFVVEFTE